MTGNDAVQLTSLSINIFTCILNESQRQPTLLDKANDKATDFDSHETTVVGPDHCPFRTRHSTWTNVVMLS
jgi:hypothetical protein